MINVVEMGGEKKKILSIADRCRIQDYLFLCRDTRYYPTTGNYKINENDLEDLIITEIERVIETYKIKNR